MATMLWRLNLQPASFRGAGFKVDTASKDSGRRIVEHEFPMRDTPWGEDMGRRARRWRVTAYIIQGPQEPDYQSTRDALINALELRGSGILVHPTMGTDLVVVDTYSVTESRERGGYCTIEMSFREAGQQISTAITVDTSSIASSTAQTSQAAIAAIPPPTPLIQGTIP